MGKKCFELKQCPYFLGTVSDDMNCPVFDEKTTCWNFDWQKLYLKLAKKDRENWKIEMIKFCQTCSVYADHKKEMDKNFELFV